jgi:hypothetical protein
MIMNGDSVVSIGYTDLANTVNFGGTDQATYIYKVDVFTEDYSCIDNQLAAEVSSTLSFSTTNNLATGSETLQDVAEVITLTTPTFSLVSIAGLELTCPCFLECTITAPTYTAKTYDIY